MSRTGKKTMHKEMRNWRKNKTENWKLAETHDLFEKQHEDRLKAYSRETDKLNKELGIRTSKSSPSVDEYMLRKQKRHDEIRAMERARHDRRYDSICSENMRKFKRLSLPDVRDMPPEMTQLIFQHVTEKVSRGTAAKSVDNKSKTSKVKFRIDKDAGKETDITEKQTTERTDEVADNEENEQTEEDDGEDCEEPDIPEWYIGRRRFTLAALNAIPDHLIEARRSSTGSSDLAAILEVNLPQHKDEETDSKDDKQESQTEVSFNIDSDTEAATNESNTNDQNILNSGYIPDLINTEQEKGDKVAKRQDDKQHGDTVKT